MGRRVRLPRGDHDDAPARQAVSDELDGRLRGIGSVVAEHDRLLVSLDTVFLSLMGVDSDRPLGTVTSRAA